MLTDCFCCGNIPIVAAIKATKCASGSAVEHLLAKERVAGSIPVSRSFFYVRLNDADRVRHRISSSRSTARAPIRNVAVLRQQNTLPKYRRYSMVALRNRSGAFILSAVWFCRYMNCNKMLNYSHISKNVAAACLHSRQQHFFVINISFPVASVSESASVTFSAAAASVFFLLTKTENSENYQEKDNEQDQHIPDIHPAPPNPSRRPDR